ncbi:hypothetical protein CEXT_791231 [Caerostris extrusa]|uniref:Uncharacterized protein n=1 Tax=Caerostris extrusa TaxID=172846 RepID=A0AAV4VLF3_CAEEX|nr:hypothetical protein CEXT_791231 [Caerostris extrusa]
MHIAEGEKRKAAKLEPNPQSRGRDGCIDFPGGNQKAAENILKLAKLINISQEGFKSYGKNLTAPNSSEHVTFQIPLNNKFESMIEEKPKKVNKEEEIENTPFKPPPLMLTLTANCTLDLYVNRKFPGNKNTLKKRIHKNLSY